MKNLKSTLASAAIAAMVVVSGCASLEGPSDAPDIVASMQASSQTGGE
jgi:outer membrane lipoprotein-sorting protein